MKNRVAWEIKKRRGTDDAAAEEGEQFHDTAIEAAFLESVGSYQVQPWAGPLTMFRPPLRPRWEIAPDRLVDQHQHYMFDDNDWTQHAPQITVHEVPGDHDSMVLEPNVRVLAARMKHILEEAEYAASLTQASTLKEAAE